MCKLLLWCILINMSFIGYSQSSDINYRAEKLGDAELVATYSLSYQQDSLDPHDIRNEEMLLFLMEDVSVFLSYNNYLAIEQYKSFSSVEDMRQTLQSPGEQTPPTRFRYQIFKNYPEGKITKINSIMGDFFKYRQSLNAFDWELTSETSEMNGFKVQKATTEYGGRTWVAWFTPDIPYNDGPYKFNGLPGLILETRDTRDHYVFELVSVERPEEPMFIEFPERNYIETTKKKFFRARQSFHDDIISRASEAGLSIESQQTAAENLRRRNNPLELKVD